MTETRTGSPSSTSGLLVLADISGYTAFLQAVAEAHADDAFADGAVPDAYAVISHLLDGIVERLVPPFTLSKLEGDAVFAYTDGAGEEPVGRVLFDCMVACYSDFRERVDTARAVWPCWCDACSRISALDLKFVLHAGGFVIQDIAGGRELVGPQVVAAHRLLKPSTPELAGAGGFALVTRAAAELSGLPVEDALHVVETVEHYPPIDAYVLRVRSVRGTGQPVE